MKLVTQGAGLNIENLDKAFGANEVLRGVSLRGEPGEFIALVGKSGCGKSTLLRLIAGLETPTQGEIQVNDAPVRGIQAQTRLMFQDARLLPWKRVLDNVALGLPRSERDRAKAALAEVGLENRGGDWPAILSGGQRQRVALARALATNPRLLLLDEPLGALDALTRLEMQNLIERLWQAQEFTTVLVTHDPEEAVALADRVVVLDAGQVALDLPIPLARPRVRSHSAFLALKERVLDNVMAGDWAWQARAVAASI